MPLATSYTEGATGELAWLAQVATFFNTYEGTAPTNYEPVGAWTDYTPTVTASTTSPTLSTNSSHVYYGRYKQNGKEVKCQFAIRFGTTGRNAGAGQYFIALPVPAKTTPAGLTSINIGHGGLWRGDGALDLIGAHPEVWYYISGTTPTTMGIVGNAIHVPRESLTATIIANQSAIANTGADLTGLALTLRQKQSTTRWKVRGYVRASLDATASRSVYLNVQEGSTVLGAGSTWIGATGGFTNSATIIAETPIFVPSAGDHTYKLFSFADSSGNFSILANATNPAFIEAIQMPGIGPMSSTVGGNNDYVGDSNPWDWSAQAGQAEIWGSVRYEVP